MEKYSQNLSNKVLTSVFGRNFFAIQSRNLSVVILLVSKIISNVLKASLYRIFVAKRVSK